MNHTESELREQLDITERLNAQLAFENQRLREALEPFSCLCDYIEARNPNTANLDVASVTFTHLRAARTALESANA